MSTTLKTAVVPLLTQITDWEKPVRMSMRGQAGESECESESGEELEVKVDVEAAIRTGKKQRMKINRDDLIPFSV